MQIQNLKQKKMKKTLGGDRLGSGKKMTVDLRTFERSTHDLSYLWRSTMSAGTLIPFMVQVGLPGDTFDIKLNANTMTHPTVGPLFGSYKLQLDVFVAPIRLYQGILHNNKTGIGLNMSQIKLPRITMAATTIQEHVTNDTIDTYQINPSCLLPYLGIRGVGNPVTNVQFRHFNATSILMYWEVYKNYYAFKQSNLGAVIHSTINQMQNIVEIDVFDAAGNSLGTLAEAPSVGGPYPLYQAGGYLVASWSGALTARPDLDYIMVHDISTGQNVSLNDLCGGSPVWSATSNAVYIYALNTTNDLQLTQWLYKPASDQSQITPKVATFPLGNIDLMRELILQAATSNSPFSVDGANLTPYKWLTDNDGTFYYRQFSQEGLAIKTYQSDIFNNWLATENINAVTTATSIDVSSGILTMDSILLTKKVYEMLNAINVSGGSYDDWIDTVWGAEKYRRVESPMYIGGLSKELVFQEVVSNAAQPNEPLGTLAGRGVLSGKHKGGYIHVTIDEPSYIMGIVSLTPRIDQSQGNNWDVTLNSMDDFHKPYLDEIGFQDLITEKMAWWDTYWDNTSGNWIQRSAGYQPAWVDYMTNYNRVYGNFAQPANMPNSEQFMVLNRRYEVDTTASVYTIKDLTTYIDPVKYNHIFAQTSLDAQNFWTQIAVDMTARRKMSYKIMPAM